MKRTDHPSFKINDDTWAISDFLMDSMYLLTGTKRALLIDTGLGIGNIMEKVSGMTQLPVTVVMTHGHLDHAGGAGNIDEFFMSPDDDELMNTITTQKRRDLVYSSAERKSLPVTFDVEENITDWAHTPKYQPIYDGDEFDLGGRTIQVISAPGHTRGSVVFLDRKNRYLFSGDACNFNLVMAKPLNFNPGEKFDQTQQDWVAKFASSVSTCLSSLERLRALSDQYDWNFTGHLDEIGNKPESHDLTDALILCCKNIIAKGVPETYIPNMPYQESVGRAKITYLPNRIFE